jgi:hypothetical protein
MFRKLSIFGLTGVLVLVGGELTMALAGNSITQPETIVLTETTVKERFLDVGKQGGPPTPGDAFFFVDTLTDEADTKVGAVRGHCTFQIAPWGTCEAGAFLTDRGQIYVEGVVRFAEQTTVLNIPITGGTGDFDNARGSVLLEFLDPNSGVNQLTINVLP